jgi:hypothetical protein
VEGGSQSFRGGKAGCQSKDLLTEFRIEKPYEEVMKKIWKECEGRNEMLLIETNPETLSGYDSTSTLFRHQGGLISNSKTPNSVLSPVLILSNKVDLTLFL